MFAKRMLLIAVAVALLAAATGCGRRSSCRQQDCYEPEVRNYDPCCR